MAALETKKDFFVQNAKPELEKQFNELLFAATQLIEAFDYGDSILDMDNAIDELREVINNLDYG